MQAQYQPATLPLRCQWGSQPWSLLSRLPLLRRHLLSTTCTSTWWRQCRCHLLPACRQTWGCRPHPRCRPAMVCGPVQQPDWLLLHVAGTDFAGKATLLIMLITWCSHTTSKLAYRWAGVCHSQWQEAWAAAAGGLVGIGPTAHRCEARQVLGKGEGHHPPRRQRVSSCAFPSLALMQTSYCYRYRQLQDLQLATARSSRRMLCSRLQIAEHPPSHHPCCSLQVRSCAWSQPGGHAVAV